MIRRYKTLESTELQVIERDINSLLEYGFVLDKFETVVTYPHRYYPRVVYVAFLKLEDKYTPK